MSSMSKDSLFPHDEIREGQDALIKDLQKAVTEGKILIAHAPTGLGKTASALSVMLEHALEKKKKVLFLTNRHTQHKIAVETLQLIKKKTGRTISCVDLIGKRWMCNQEIAGLFGTEFNEFCKSVVEKGECEFYNNVKVKKELTVEAKLLIKELKVMGPLHNEDIIKICKEKKMCSYETSIAMAKEADVIIGDYYYLFNPFVQLTLFNKLNLEIENVVLIVDEAHNLPSRVTEMLSSNLTSYMLKNAILESKKFGYGGLIKWLQEINKTINDLAKFEDKWNREKLIKKDDFSKKVNQVYDYDELINQLELAADEVRKKQRKSYLGGVSTFLGSWKGEDEGFVRVITQRESKYGPITTLSYSCLDPSIVTKDIFKSIDSGIIMSGTLKPTHMYKDILGIKNGIEQEYGSPFPTENKLSIIIPETSTKYNLRGEAMYKQIAEKCTTISALIPGNVAFFFPSYDLRDKVAMFVGIKKKLFWEKSDMTKEDKEIFLNQFREAKNEGGVLLGVAGANFAEGVDLPGDLLNGVVVVGLPLAKPDIKTKEIIKYYEDKYGKGWDYGYIFPAMSKCIQSAGRCIRSGTDKGAIIYLDERFAWQNYYNCLPREGLIVSKKYEEMLKKFFI
jgi:DNA excision repair protein ERCC-2